MRLTLRNRMLLSIALPTALIFVVVLGAALAALVRSAGTEVEAHMTGLAERYASGFDAYLRRAMAVADTTASAVELARPDREGLYALLRTNVDRSPFIYGAALAFEPGTVPDAPTRLFAPYVYRDDGRLAQMNISEDVLDWYTDPRWQWWHRAKSTGRGTWTAPYFDDGAGNAWMVTYSAPFTDDEGGFAGVATVDIEIPGLGETVGRHVLGARRFYILAPDGTFVFSSDRDRIGTNVFERAGAEGRADVEALARAVTGGGRGVTRITGPRGTPNEGRSLRVFYAPIPATGWGFASELPEAEAMAGVRRRVALLGGALGATLALIIASIWFVSGRMTRPVRRLRDAVARVAGGDLDARVEGVDCDDEVGDVARSFNEMSGELRSVLRRLAEEEARRRDEIIFSMAKLTESRDDDTGKHLERICRYTEIIARELGKEFEEIDEDWIRTVTTTAALHDIGKVGVPDAVLKKPGKLTPDERAVIEKHTLTGGDTLMALWRKFGDDPFLASATQIALYHHERWDGSGYPYALSGEEIALPARIVAVADVYDALTSRRVYKPAMTHERACEIIREGSGSHFDPRVVEAFERVSDVIRRASEDLRS